MSQANEQAHITSVLVEVPARRAYAYLTSIEGFRRWSLGCLQTLEDAEGRWHGRSLFDGEGTWCRVDADEKRLLVDFHVGVRPNDLAPRINARIVDGPVLGHNARHCLITLTAYRTSCMNAERWRRLQATHECEIHLIKEQLESDID